MRFQPALNVWHLVIEQVAYTEPVGRHCAHFQTLADATTNIPSKGRGTIVHAVQTLGEITLAELFLLRETVSI